MAGQPYREVVYPNVPLRVPPEDPIGHLRRLQGCVVVGIHHRHPCRSHLLPPYVRMEPRGSRRAPALLR
eukprot:3626394-Prymnesium_polylepis.1